MPIAPRLTEAELDAMTPLGNQVVIRKWEPPTVMESGLHIPEDRNNYQCKRGTVVKIAPCLNRKGPMPDLKVGDEVVFSAFSGVEIPMPVGYLIMPIDAILAVLDPD